MSIRAAVALSALAVVVLSGCGRHESLATQPLSGPSLQGGVLSPDVSGTILPGDGDGGAGSAPAISGTTVTLPAGSVDGLAAAIAAAGPGGRVVVASGAHTESGPVTITHTVEIQGEPGAVLTSTTAPVIAPTDPVQPALHVLGASRVRISGLELRPSGAIGGAAFLLENAADATLSDNRVFDYQYGVMLHEANQATIDRNTIAVSTAWQVGTLSDAHGIVVINGDRAKITANDVSGGLFNIWACDTDGSLLSNFVHDGFIGIILCKVPAGAYRLPGGNAVGSEFAGTNWMCRRNVARNNFDAGYLVIDGANRNMLVENSGSDNGTYDIELTGDTFRFGFLTPASFQNTVRVGSESELRIKNCGNDNTVIRGNQVDVGTDPCS